MAIPDRPDETMGGCLACGHTRARVRHYVGPYTIRQCTRCLLAWTEGAKVEPAEFYDRDYFVGTAGQKGYNDYPSLAAAMGRTNRSRLGRLRRLVPGARTLLDVGSGPGFFVKEASESGLQACGLEVSEYAVRYAAERLGVSVFHGALDEEHLNRLGGSFDLITLWDVIEHLARPDESLGLLADRLTPGGLLSLSTGDIGSLVARLSGRHWHLLNLPEHLWFFTVPALRHLLARSGLVAVSVRREVCWFTLKYLLERLVYSLGGRHTELPGVSVLGRLSLPCTLLDVVTVLARKRTWSPAGVVKEQPARLERSTLPAGTDAQGRGAVGSEIGVAEELEVCVRG